MEKIIEECKLEVEAVKDEVAKENKDVHDQCFKVLNQLQLPFGLVESSKKSL